jgi:hypothetical protein
LIILALDPQTIITDRLPATSLTFPLTFWAVFIAVLGVIGVIGTGVRGLVNRTYWDISDTSSGHF